VVARPVSLDPTATQPQMSSNDPPNIFKQWRGLATRYDKLALTYRAASSSVPLAMKIEDTL
jgi:hypothetical protein